MMANSTKKDGIACPQCRNITKCNSALELKANVSLKNMIVNLQANNKASAEAKANAANTATNTASTSAGGNKPQNFAIVMSDEDSANWVSDDKVNECTLCQKPFGMFRRRHHW